VGQSRYGDGQEFSWQQVEVKKQWHENCHAPWMPFRRHTSHLWRCKHKCFPTVMKKLVICLDPRKEMYTRLIKLDHRSFGLQITLSLS